MNTTLGFAAATVTVIGTMDASRAPRDATETKTFRSDSFFMLPYACLKSE